MQECAVAAMGRDRPGIVAAMTEALTGAGASIEDSSMTILGGQFAMLLLVEFEHGADELRQVLAPVASELGLMLEVRPSEAAQEEDGAVGGEAYVVAAYGPDRPGLVAALARVLADEGANVTDFGSRLTGSGVFAMWFNVLLPSGTDMDELQERLRQAGGEVSLEVNVHREEVEAL